LSSVCTW